MLQINISLTLPASFNTSTHGFKTPLRQHQCPVCLFVLFPPTAKRERKGCPTLVLSWVDSPCWWNLTLFTIGLPRFLVLLVIFTGNIFIFSHTSAHFCFPLLIFSSIIVPFYFYKDAASQTLWIVADRSLFTLLYLSTNLFSS